MASKEYMEKLSEEIIEYDFERSTIEFTNICSSKCNVLKLVNDTLDQNEISCLSNLFVVN